MLRPAAALLVAAALLPRSASNDPLPIHVLDAAAATRSGAVCMDGTPPAFYINRTANPATANSWVLFFQGGGWCTSLQACAARAKGALGSSKVRTPAPAPEVLSQSLRLADTVPHAAELRERHGLHPRGL